jgi:hypothetical protein
MLGQHHPGALQLLQSRKRSSLQFAAREPARCPKCFAKLALVGITPGSPGFEIKSLECPECQYTIAQRVAVDAI